MKPIRPSNWKAKRRVLYTLVLGVTALWAMPECARAQLYVSQSTTNTVGKYDAATGAVINANFITGDINPIGLALSGDGTALFVASNSTGTVGKYNASTGAAINANFITTGPTTTATLSPEGAAPLDSRCRATTSLWGASRFRALHLLLRYPEKGSVRLANTTPPWESRLTPTSLQAWTSDPNWPSRPHHPFQLQLKNSSGRIQSRASTVSGSCTTGYPNL